MTAHLRARAAQAGAFLAIVGGIIAAASAPALADQPDVQITSVSSTDLPAGGRTTMSYTVTNANQLPSLVRIRVTGADCRRDCTPVAQLGPDETKQFTAELTAPQVDPGQTRTVTVQINATAGNDTGQATQELTVRGPDKPQTVRQIVGRVKDSSGKPVPGATVGVRDSQGHSYTTTTNDDGRFRFTSTDRAPILAGAISVGAVKQGFQAVTVSMQGVAGKPLTVPLTLQGGEVRTTSTPSAAATTTPPPTEESTGPATAAAADATTADTANAANTSSSPSSLLFIILGALLVAAGVGAIVLVLMRRRSPEDEDGPGGVEVPAAVVPPAQGRFPDATRIAAGPVTGANDATMVTRPSVSDAPTMVQQAVPVEDEFADPYGAPAPRAYTNGFGGGAYGGPVPAQPAGYDPGPPTQYTPPVRDEDPYAAFGAAPPPGGGGYAGPQQQYDEPTGRYHPEAGGVGYGAHPGYRPGVGYPAAAEPGTGTGAYRPSGDGGYGQPPDYRRGESTGAYSRGGYPSGGYGAEPGPGGYGSRGAPAGGIDSGNAYGPPADAREAYDANRGGYGNPDAGYGDYGAPGGRGPGSYGPSAGDYGDAGYGRRPTYGGAPDPYDAGAYEDQDGYGREQGGYYGAAPGDDGRHGGQSHQLPPRSRQPDQRRPIDWLDD